MYAYIEVHKQNMLLAVYIQTLQTRWSVNTVNITGLRTTFTYSISICLYRHL